MSVGAVGLAPFLSSVRVDRRVGVEGQGFGVYAPPPPPPSTYGKNYGRFRPLLNGHVVLGPQPSLFASTCLFFIGLIILLALQADDIIPVCGEAVVGLGFLLIVLAFFTFIVVCLSDPGIVPRDYRLRELIYDTVDFRARNPEANFIRFCEKCRSVRPPGCHHCSRCNICIRDQEFHLFTGGTCVGQRTARASFFLSFMLGLLAAYLIAVNCLIITDPELVKGGMTERRVKTYVSLGLGIMLLFLPQLGVILFLFRIYFITNGLTTRGYLNKLLEQNHCEEVAESQAKCTNIVRFFFDKKAHSVFRKRMGTSDAEEIRENLDIWMNIVRTDRDRIILEDIMNANVPAFPSPPVCPVVPPTEEEIEAILMRDLAASARPKLIPSVPQINQGELEKVPGSRVKRILRPRPCETLQRELEEFTRSRQLPRSVFAQLKQGADVSHVTLSEGSLPRTADNSQSLLTAARAAQFRRLIELILTRDREGLNSMGRRVNIPALLGTDHFDPDNMQFVELSNGLPMLAPRRRDLHFNLQRFNGLLGIPQMVAAGYLPPARELASNIESNLGAGTVRRVSNLGHNHFVYQVQDPEFIPAPSTRPLPLLRHSHHNRQNDSLVRLATLPLDFPDLDRQLPPSALQRLRNITRNRRRREDEPVVAMPNVHFWNDVRPQQLFPGTSSNYSVRNPFTTSIPTEQRGRLLSRRTRRVRPQQEEAQEERTE